MGWGPAAPDLTAANTAAKNQAAIAMEQWAKTKEYLPKAMALADAENARSDRLADASEADSKLYRGIAQHQFEQAGLAEPFQQQMRDTATAYSSGSVGDGDAGRANVDVEQGFNNATGSMARSAGRMGLNVGSAGFASAMGDMYTQKALASAGAQTNARSNARIKAEALFAEAAGAGKSAFENGRRTGEASSVSADNAVHYGAAGLGAVNSVQTNYGTGVAGAASQLGSAAVALRRNAVEAASSPGFDMFAGLATAGLKGWGAGRLG